MSAELDLVPRAKLRVVKPAPVRRAEIIDCAQRLFLEKGYERTTISDVIEAMSLSKGAFYHHFRAKEDLLEAIAERFATQAVDQASAVTRDPALDALARLNRMLAMSRDWKAEHIGPLKAMFTTLLRPENAVLYHRIVAAVFSAMAPAFKAVIDEGAAEGVFDLEDADLAAEALLWLGEGRRLLVVRAMQAAEAGDMDAAVALLVKRLKSEEALVDRILGLPPGSVDLMGPVSYLRAITEAWVADAAAQS